MGYYITADELKRDTATYISAAFKFTDKVREIDTKRVRENIIFNYDQISTEPSFYGKNQFFIEFTSIDEYTVHQTKTDFYIKLYRGSSNIGSDFQVGDDILIPANTFAGAISEGDVVTFAIDGFISEAELEVVIEDAELEVDNYAKSRKILLHNMDLDHLPLFIQNLPLVGNYENLATIPLFREIKLATRQYALAILIERRMLPVTLGKDLSEGYNQTLRETGQRILNDFLERYKYGEISSISASALMAKKGACAENLKELHFRLACDKNRRRRIARCC